MHNGEKTARLTTNTKQMKALKCKPSAQFAYNYSINVLNKCSNIISHPSLKVDRHVVHPSSKIDTLIFEGRHINHRSSKVNTSISEGRHIDFRKLAQRSSKVGTSIFEDTRRKHRTNNPTSHQQSCAHTYLYIVYTATATLRVTPHVH